MQGDRAGRAVPAPWLATVPSQVTYLPLSVLALVIASAPILVALYAYALYPVIVWVVGLVRPRHTVTSGNEVWPMLTVTVPVYNNVASIRATLERVLQLDYPREKLQYLVLSDASSDGTDDVVREFADRGVELLRAPTRRGKTAAENAAVAVARGEIIVNIDATVVVPPGSLRPLIRAFADPTVGVASGCDVSVAAASATETRGESGYTGYEMLVRKLETRAGSIVGASGCFYGIRRKIRGSALAPGLSWDFASTLVAREQGYRSVSVPDAVCVVPSTQELRFELRRKARTMARGISTLFHFRSLMNPLRYGGFALMLVSHKLLRWVPYLLAPLAFLALGILAMQSAIAAILFGLVGLGLVAGAISIKYARVIALKPIALAGFVVAACSAGWLAWFDAIRGARMVTWDPTPRPTVSTW